jgi:hypothetical protein
MLNLKTTLALACLGVATGLTLTQAVADDVTVKTDSTTVRTTNDNTNNTNTNNNDMNRNMADRPLLPTGIASKNLNADKAIEKAFKGVTEAAMNKTGFDNLVSYTVDQDRDRISKSISSGSLNNINGSKNQRLTDLIASIEGGWKSKYNGNFDLDIGKVYTNDYIHIQTGEVTDPNLLVNKWPVMPSLGTGNAGKLTQAEADEARKKMFGGDVNLEKGRNIAVAQFQTNQFFSGLNASLIHEAGGWKFDIPNTMTAQRLYDNLVNNLSALDRARDQWPSDANEAYRRFTQAVVAAMYDAPYPGEVLKPVPGAAMAK